MSDPSASSPQPQKSINRSAATPGAAGPENPTGTGGPGNVPGTGGAVPPRPRRKWLRWTIGIVIGLVVLLIGLILLAPTIASSGAVRSIVVGRINDNLNGKLEIADWSISWSGGISADGIRVTDAAGRQILQIKHLSTQLPLMSATRGDLQLGKTVVDGVDFVAQRQRNGQFNFRSLAKLTPMSPSSPAASPATPAQPAPSGNVNVIDIPKISGDLVISNVQGTYQDDLSGQSIQIAAIDGEVKFPDINGTITDRLAVGFRDLAARAGAGTGTITLEGSSAPIINNKLDLDHPHFALQQKLTLSNIDLASAGPTLAAAGQAIAPTGTAQGTLNIRANSADDLALNGEIDVSHFVVSGAALSGDTFDAGDVQIPIDIAVAAKSGPNAASSDSQVMVKALAVRMKQGSASVTVDAPQRALVDAGPFVLAVIQRAMGGNAAGANGTTSQMTLAGGGSVTVAVHLDVAAILNQLPHVAHLNPGTTLSGGVFDNNSTLTLADDRATLSTKNSLTGVAGTSDGKPITLGDITNTAAVTTIGGKAPAVADLAVGVNSGFLTLEAHGATLSQLSAAGTFDAGELQSRVGSLLNLGSIRMRGTGKLAVSSSGDPSVPGSTVKMTGDLELTGIGAALTSADRSLDVSTQTVSTTLAASIDSASVVLSSPLTLAVRGLSITRINPDGSRTAVLQNETADASVAGRVTHSAGATTVDLSTLSVTALHDLVTMAKSGDQDLAITLQKSGSIGGNGSVMLAADIKRAMDLVQSLNALPAASGPSLQSARLAGTLAFNHPIAATASDLKGDLKLSQVTVGTALNNETIDMPFSATLPDDGMSLSAALDMNASMASLSVQDVKVVLARMVDGKTQPVGVLDQLQNAHVLLKNADLAKLDTILNALSPPATGAPVAAATAGAAATPGAVPPAPILISSGTGNADLTISRTGQTTGVVLNQLALSNLAISRGPASYRWRKDVTLKTEITIDGSADAASDVLEQIRSITVKTLDGQFGFASATMATPIAITSLAATQPSIAGAIGLDGDIAGVCRLAEALGGVATGSYPYAGKLTLVNNLSNERARWRLKQTGKIDNFTVYPTGGTGNPVFSESLISLNNNLAVNPRSQTLVMDGDGVNIVMATSHALGIKLTGTIHDWAVARQFQEPLKLGLDYDLAKLWTIILPMLSKDQQQAYADLKLTGAYHRDFVVSGSYPAGPAMNESIKPLLVSGDLVIDLFDHSGLTVQSLDVPVGLKNGLLRIAYTGKPTTQELPAVAQCNDGKLDIGGISLDLADPHPRLNIPANKALVAGATINPVFAGSYLKEIVNNPVFADPKQAQGLLDLTSVACTKFPLDQLMNSTGPENDGHCELHYSMTQMHIGSTMIGAILAATGGRGDQSVSCQIRDGKVVVDHGKAVADSSLEVSDQNYAFRFFGTVGLAKQDFEPFTVSVPTALIGKAFKIDKRTMANAAPTLDVPVKGTLSSPVCKPGDVIGKFIKDTAAKSLLNQFGGAPANPNNGGAAAATQPAPDNPLQQLNNIFGGPKKAK